MDNPFREQALDLLRTLNWDIKPDEISRVTDEVINEMKKIVDHVLSLEEDKICFRNTLQEMEIASAELNYKIAPLYFLAYVSTDPEVRKASNQSSMKLSQFQIELSMNNELFEVIKKIEDEEDTLEGADKLLLSRTLRDFRRMGLDLSKEKQERIKEIEQELSTLRIEFQQALNELDDKIIFGADELQGIPENLLKSLRKLENGDYEVGVSYPEADAILGYCSNPETRERYSVLFGNRAREQNTPRLNRALELRDKKAKLMGYHSHAEFILDIKMASDPRNVINFLNELKSKLHPLGKKELQELIDLKKKERGTDADENIRTSDYRYYTNILNDKKYKIDKQEIKQYFPTLYVVDKMLEFYQDIFGLKFHEITDAPKWHEDVRAFSISDTKTGGFIGTFYLDLYPRAGKFNHAAAFTLIRGFQKRDGSYQPTSSAMVCNFPKETEDTPSLLNHSEVETLFHEFGHIIHQTTTKAKYAKFSGSNVSRDFVEAPSQMLENWVWEEEILSDISRHYKTGEPLPKQLLEKMIAAKNANVGLKYLRQLFFGLFDMTIHHMWNCDLDIGDLWTKLQKEVSLVETTNGTYPAASFGHIMGGYDAGYYGYLWSEVIAQDLYTRFEEEGVKAKNVGMDYRKYILEPGNEVPETELVEKYLGRPYNNEAFIRSLGLENVMH